MPIPSIDQPKHGRREDVSPADILVCMAALVPGSAAPAVAGIDFSSAPTVLWFYKVTCPICQMAAPVAGTLARAYPGRFTGIGQDPEKKLAEFDHDYGLGFDSRPDLPPYDVSNAYGIRVVPTMYMIGPEGIVLDAVESWDRDGYGRVARRMAELVGTTPADLSGVTAGLPVFRPG